MSASSLAIFLSLVAGIAGSVQAAVSGAFGKKIGVLEATAFGACLAAVTSSFSSARPKMLVGEA